MPATMYNISGFAGSVWDREFEEAFKSWEGIYPRFRMKTVPAGTKTVQVPVFGGLTAHAFTPGGGSDVTLQAGSQSAVSLVMDRCYETSVLVDDVQRMQSAVDDREALVREVTAALLGRIDADVISMCGAYTGLPAAQKVATTAEVENTPSAVAAEQERLIMEGVTILDGLLGTRPRGAFCIIDSWVYRRLLGASSKQSPERIDSGYAYSTGVANPIQGVQLVPYPATSRAYSEYDTATTIKAYLAVPSAIVVGVQQSPDLVATYEGMKRATLLSAAVVYGIKEAVGSGFVELTLKVNGNVFGL